MKQSRQALRIGVIAACMLVAWSRLGSVERELQCPNGCGPEVRKPGIVAYELAGTAERADAILAAWGEEGRAVARRNLILDYAFLLTYGLFLYFAGQAIAASLSSGPGFFRRPVGVARIFAFAGAGAAALDAVENAALLVMLSRGGNDLPAAMAYTAAGLKFVLVLPTFAFVLLCGAPVLVWQIVRKVRRR